MAGVSITVTVPKPLAAAIDGEAHRRLVRRGDVVRDCLARVWPAYVAAVLADDLRPILDAEVADDDDFPLHATAPPELPGGAVETSSRQSVVCSVADDSTSGSSGAAT